MIALHSPTIFTNEFMHFTYGLLVRLIGMDYSMHSTTVQINGAH